MATILPKSGAASPPLAETFARIYSTDLVYVPGCWQLCGDAHCCSFSRYKNQFRLLSRQPFQELPLLPGEYAFLEHRGWLTQFGDYDLKTSHYELGNVTLELQSIISRRPNCACDHDTRPVVCRLYPLLPVFDVSGRCIGTEPLGIFEELERIGGLASACQLQALPVGELNKFLAVADELARQPLLLFYLEAYRLTKRHVSQRLAAAYTPGTSQIFSQFEGAFLRNKLIDHKTLKPELTNLVERFRDFYGPWFAVA